MDIKFKREENENILKNKNLNVLLEVYYDVVTNIFSTL